MGRKHRQNIGSRAQSKNSNKGNSRISLGNKSEDLVVRWLAGKGYRVISRNFSCRFGEIDIIAVKARVLYFVEVRSRRSVSDVAGRAKVGVALNFGEAIESVTSSKLRKIQKTAEIYIARNGRWDMDFSILLITVNWYNRSQAKVRMVPVY